ncbi:MAG: UvrD-helicase domain-containing protein [Planctomycetaceae bacterium]|nr:UvrD-helicase domain-containing protein [Planctomycetaceae bacterium]
MRTDTLLNGLNAPQRDAVATDSGPLLVLAGAGTGKTRVVTYRIARLIRGGISPDRILAVTFTNKAASEMVERVSQLIGRKRKVVPEISTFHSLCVRVLRRHSTKIGYPAKFAIYDRGDQESTAARVLREINIPTAQMKPSELLYLISGWKMRSILPDKAAGHAQTDKEHLAAAAYRRYQKNLKAAGAVDFDDLLLCTEQLFEQSPEARRSEAGRFDHVLIDEYQDTNGSQYRIIKALAVGHRNLCVVGDDDQSIYGWRGAEVEHILRFNVDWPDAKVVRLEDNYRSTAEIIQLANRLIRYNRVRHDKKLNAARAGGERPKILQFPNETDEAEQTVADIARKLARKEVEASDFAILFRTNEQPRLFESELRRAKIPYVLIGGMSFFDRKEVRDILSYLRVLVTPEDEPSLLRIINTPPRGISQKAVQALVDEAVSRGAPVWDVLSDAGRLPDCSSNSVDGTQKLLKLVRSYQSRIKEGKLSQCLTDLIGEIQYENDIRRRFKEDPEAQQARWNTVEELVNALAEYETRAKKPTLIGFLDDILLSGRDQDRDKDKQLGRNAVILMTLHSAKGLEFPHVYMVGMEEGLLPHHRSVAVEGDAIDEERRLCYVGITRAEERLTLSLALTRRKWGKPRPTDPSRFLFEIAGQADNPHASSTQKEEPSVSRPSAARPKSKRPKAGRPKASRSPSRRPKANRPAKKRPKTDSEGRS